MSFKRIVMFFIIIAVCFSFHSVSNITCSANDEPDIQLSYTKLIMKRDTERTITIKGNYNLDKINYLSVYSDNEYIVETQSYSFDNNSFDISAEHNGTANITVYVYGDNDVLLKTLKCTVVVGKIPSFDFPGYIISLDEPSAAIGINDLPKVFKPTWSSSNNKVASFDSKGRVIGVGKGTCTLKATIAQITLSMYVDVRWFPNYKSKITKINTKKKYLKIRYKNICKKPMKINTKGATLWITDKKGYRLKGKPVTVKSGKTKVVKFRIIGKKIKKLKKHSYVYYKIKIDGKTYKAWTEKRIKDGVFEYVSSHKDSANIPTYHETK